MLTWLLEMRAQIYKKMPISTTVCYQNKTCPIYVTGAILIKSSFENTKSK